MALRSVRPRRVWLALFALALLTPGCFRRESAVQSGNRDQVLHRGIGSEPGDLDPQLATNIAEGDLASALFEGLVAEDPVDLHPVPGTAESWEISPDQLTYTFHLRPNARWSDGTPVTASDFVRSWQRVLSPALAAPNADLLYLLQGAEAYHKGVARDFSKVGVTAVDPHTLKVLLEHPAPHFLSLLSLPAWMPVPVGVINAHGSIVERGNRWTRPGELVGNGPFTLKSWEANRRIVMEKSATYWDAAQVRLNAIHFYPIDSIPAEERAFRSGQLHVTYVLPLDKVRAYRRDAPQFLRTDPYLNTYFLRLNTRRPPFGDARVRQALARAIDRQALVEKILHGGQQAATTITPPGLPNYVPPPGVTADLAAARRLLTAAGFPDGRGLPPIELLYNTSDNHRTLAEAIQEMWRRELGIDVRLVSQEFKVVLEERRAGRYQVLLSDWVGDYLDPATFLEPWRSDSGNNHTGWSSPEYDSLLFAAARAATPADRAQAFQQAETLLIASAPIVPLYYNAHVFLVQPAVKGWNPTLLDHHPYKHVWLEE